MGNKFLSRLAVVSAIFLLGSGVAISVAQAATSKTPTGAVAPPALDSQVTAVLNRACTLIASHKLVHYRAEINFDSVLPSLVKLQYAAVMEVSLERPNRLAMNYQSDLGAKRIWYDGEHLTIFDPAHMAYASAAAPDSIDAMIAQVAEQKNLTIPLAGFDVSNPCARVRGQITHSKYVGINMAGGVECDHLAFVQPEADGSYGSSTVTSRFRARL